MEFYEFIDNNNKTNNFIKLEINDEIKSVGAVHIKEFDLVKKIMYELCSGTLKLLVKLLVYNGCFVYLVR